MEISFGFGWSPTSTWITLSSVGGSCCSERLFHWKWSTCSPWISIEWLNILIVIYMTDQCHVDKEILADNPLVTSDSYVDGSEEYDGRDLSVSDSDCVGEWHTPTSCVSDYSNWLAFLLAQKVAKGCVVLYQNSSPSPWGRLYPISFIIRCADRA